MDESPLMDLGDADLNHAIILAQGLRHHFALRAKESPVRRAYAGSPFEYLLTLPPKQKGEAFERLVAGLARDRYGVEVKSTSGTESDRAFGDVAVEIKGATLGHKAYAAFGLQFNQIRRQDYEYLFLLGVLPWRLVAWAIPKQEVLARWEQGAPCIRSQHGGKEATETAMLLLPIDDVPDWVDRWGGDFSDAMRAIQTGTARQGRRLRRQLLLIEP